MTRSLRTARVLSLFSLVLSAPQAVAQESAHSELRALDDPVISADGAWVAAEERSDRGAGNVRVWSTEGDVTFTIERGRDPRFSRDSRWVSALQEPPLEGSRTARPESERAGRTLVLLDTRDGSRRTFYFVLSYDVTGFSSYLAYLQSPHAKSDEEDPSGDNAAQPAAEPTGTLHMVELEGDRVFTWQNVTQYAAHQQTTDHYAYVAFVSPDEETGHDTLEIAVVGYAKVGWGTKGTHEGEKIEGLSWARDPITLVFLDSTETTGEDGKRRVNSALHKWHVPAGTVRGEFTRLDATLASKQREPRQPVLDDLEVVRLAGGMGFTEGPVWLPAERILVFSNIPGSRLMQWSESAGLAVFRESENPNGNLLDLDGRLLTCRHGARDIVRTEEDGSLTVVVDRFEGKRFNSPNDVAVGSDGTLWFTDPPWGLKNLSEGKELDGNWVYRLSPDGTLAAVIRDLAMPNGIALSPDGKRLYVVDTGGYPHLPDATLRDLPATLSAYEILSDGELAPEPVWRVETRCDGMCVDEHGNVYTAGNTVDVWSPDGVNIGTIKVPEQPANVCFGGDDYQTLFITARSSLYSVKLDVAGYRPGAVK